MYPDNYMHQTKTENSDCLITLWMINEFQKYLARSCLTYAEVASYTRSLSCRASRIKWRGKDRPPQQDLCTLFYVIVCGWKVTKMSLQFLVLIPEHSIVRPFADEITKAPLSQSVYMVCGVFLVLVTLWSADNCLDCFLSFWPIWATPLNAGWGHTYRASSLLAKVACTWSCEGRFLGGNLPYWNAVMTWLVPRLLWDRSLGQPWGAWLE